MSRYPLAELVAIRQRRLDEAEKALRNKKAALTQEEKKLTEVIAQRDRVKDHREQKLGQLRQESDGGTTSNVIQRMKLFLKLVEEELVQEDKKVEAQRGKVKEAQSAVDKAIEDYQKRQKAVEKLAIDQEAWVAEQEALLLKEEESTGDELGSIGFARKMVERAQQKRRLGLE